MQLIHQAEKTSRVGAGDKAANKPGSEGDLTRCRQMGHDIRQPLHALGLLLSVLEQERFSDNTHRILGYVKSAVSDINDLVNRHTRAIVTTPPGAFAVLPSFPSPLAVVGTASDRPWIGQLSGWQGGILPYRRILDLVRDIQLERSRPQLILACPGEGDFWEVLAGVLSIQALNSHIGVVFVAANPPAELASRVAEMAGIPMLTGEPALDELLHSLDVWPAIEATRAMPGAGG